MVTLATNISSIFCVVHIDQNTSLGHPVMWQTYSFIVSSFKHSATGLNSVRNKKTKRYNVLYKNRIVIACTKFQQVF